MATMRQKARCVKRRQFGVHKQHEPTTINGQRVVWQFKKISLPYKSNVSRQVEPAGDALLET